MRGLETLTPPVIAGGNTPALLRWYDFLTSGAPMKLVLTTIDNREGAESLARSIVESRLAACVNIIDRVKSIYWWENEVQHAEEMVLLIKTTPEHLEDLEQFIREHHPYDLPEFVVLEPASVSNEYLEWVRTSTR